MSELEKKFYEYFMSEYFNPKEPEKIAKELAEIAFSCFDIMSLKILELQKENTEIRELNKAQVLENAKLRVDIAELKKQKGIVIAEGEVEFFGTIGERWGVYKIGGQYINEVLEKAKTMGKKGKLIFIEDNK